MLTIFTIPSNFVASTTAVMSDVFSDLSGFLTLVVGVILAIVAIEIIIHALRPK